jgi:hypothetical protein
MSKHIYKYAIEASFFSVITNENDIEKVVKEGKPSIYMREDENTEVWWPYENEEQRDHDFEVINEYKDRIQYTLDNDVKFS